MFNCKFIKSKCHDHMGETIKWSASLTRRGKVVYTASDNQKMKERIKNPQRKVILEKPSPKSLTLINRPVALVYSGLGDNRPDKIIRELEEMGYEVVWVNWDAPKYQGDVALVVGHSAGATQAVKHWGGSGITVIALAPPVRHRTNKYDNVHYFGSLQDPVTWIGIFTGFNAEGSYSDWNEFNQEGALGAHGSEGSWKRAKEALFKDGQPIAREEIPKINQLQHDIDLSDLVEFDE